MRAIPQALTQLWRNRSGAGPVIAVIAIGVGSSAAIFSVVSAVLLADLGYVNSSRLAILWHSRPAAAGVVGVSPGDFVSHRSTSSTLEQMAIVTTRGFNLGGTASPSRVTCARMTSDMLPMLGVPPAQGRWFTAEEDQGAIKVVVLSHRLWTAQLGEDAAIVGTDVVLDSLRYRVVGIMPEAFTFPPEGVQGLAQAECWVPASLTQAELMTPAFNWVLLGRLKEGVSLEQASADAHAGAQKIWATYPAAVQSQVKLTARVVPLEEQVVAGSRTALYLFSGSVAILLLIACANVFNLMLMALDTRRRELALRASLGATQAAVILQLLTESILLALAGGIGGILVAYALLGAITSTNASVFPRLANSQIDVSALLFAVVCAVASGLASGLLPAVRAGSRSQEAGMRAHSRGFGSTRWRRALIAFELALAVIVLALAGILTRSVMNLARVDSGLVVSDVMTFSVALPTPRYETASSTIAFSERLLQALRALPGVTDAAVGTSLPIGEAPSGVVLPITATPNTDYRPTLIYAVTPEYAKVLGIAVRAGRFLETADGATAAPVAVVNETLARSLWADTRAIDRSISRIGSLKPLTIVGVVGDVRQSGPHRPAAPALYLPLAQSGQSNRSLSFVIRSGVPAAALAPRIRRAVSSVDADVPAFAVRTGAELAATTTATQRFNMQIVAIFAAFALVIAMTGLYGVVARSVEEARRDFGIRQALGASRGSILRLVMTRALAPAIAGTLVGALSAWWASALIAGLLYGARPDDPTTFTAVFVCVLVVSGLVLLVPAVRATRVDLAALLRLE